MKHLIKSNSTLNNYNFGIKNNIINKAIKLSNESQIIENRKNFTINFNLNQKTFNFSNIKNNNNETKNINLLKSPVGKKVINLRKTRNKILSDFLKSKSDINIFSKFHSNSTEKNNANNKTNNYLLLTSLYNLPKMKIIKRPHKKIYLNSHLGDTSKNEFFPSLNNSKINNRNIFNDSITTSNEKSNFTYMNLLYTNETTTKGKSTFKKRKRVLSPLSSLLNHKYYSDTEKKLKEEITEKSFPSDHSMRDKVIHMKKVGVFWDSVFKYIYPIISVRKYKVQHDIIERKRIDYLKLIKSKSKLNYYDMFRGKKIYSFFKKIEKSNSQSKIYASNIFQ